MSIPEIDSSQRFEAIADEQLQQELRGLFVVDTQHYLQKYSQIAESLQPQTWRSDIQELYRCVHTIKGGAVTIQADAVLHVATALEDVLADLRYLEVAPSLSDNHLSQALLEAGELLTGSLEPRSQAEGQEPILNRIQALHQEIRERYLPQWNEASQLHQSFAIEGLDLVVLELDIALERLPEQGTVPDSTLHTAQQVLMQLAQIGEELHLASGWAELLQHAQPLLEHRDNAVWRSQWPLLFLALKSCAKQSGKPVPFELEPFQPTHSLSANLPLVAPDTDGINGWGLEPAADLSLDAFARSSADDWDIRESDAHEPDSDESDSVLDYQQQVDAFAHIGNLLDALNPVEALSEAGIEDEAGWLVAPPFDETNSLVDWEASLGESRLVNDRQPPDETFVPDSQVDLSNSESDQDWLANTFFEALAATEAPPVSSVIDFLDVSFEASGTENFGTEHAATENVPTEVGEANLLDGYDLSDDRWELAPTTDLASQPENLLDDEPVLDWLDETIPSGDVAESRSPINGQEPVLQEMPLPQSDTIDYKAVVPKPERTFESLERVQIPVPLETLDQSAQHLVETLLTLRTTQGFYQSLQSQIAQIMALAQEGTQYITHLRQIQDDYTLLEELSHNAQATTGPTPERYRQGYTVINRLLETSLRLSEIGAETGKTTQQISEYLQNVDRNVLRLQSTIEDSRLVPFQNLSFRAKAILRDLITRYNKPAKLLVQGEKTELDVTIARNLEPALLHLIRNAYDHGLESPSERTANGKPAQGTITLSLQRQGNRFQFEIRDDGRGIDANAIRARAEALGLPLSRTQTPAELLAVICQPGFSAQSQVSEISGRGVGMDVVAAQVARLGGRLSLDTTPGKGTTFQLQFPVPRLLVPCVLIRVGDQALAIPEDDIRTITLLSDLDASSTEGTDHAYAWTIRTDAGTLPALDLLKYWQPRTADRALTDTTVCLYIALAGTQQGVWLLADELLEQAELIINPIPKPLAAPNGFIGVSLQNNGLLIPVLEARALAEQLLATPTPNPEAVSIAPSDVDDSYGDYQAQSILIVDDAALMRRRLEASLNTNGYLTHTCADGQEAWQWLQTNPHPDLVITDIEMPNMDGFTLVDRCRQAGIKVPILVVSSRLSEEWFDEARRLGANDYLTKGFSTVDLLKKVNALLNLLVH